MELGRLDKELEELRVLGIIITKDGQEILSRMWDGVCRRNVYSASKTYTALAVGMAQAEGLLSLDEKLTDAFCDDLPQEVPENLRKATVRDLLTMCLGQEKAFLMGEQRYAMEEDDWVKASLAQPFAYEPDTHFVYNNVGPYLAGMLVQRRAGCDLVTYLQPRLFTPMGIKRPTWETDPLGYTFGAGGLMLTLPEMHKLGLLFSQEGMWNGQQLVPAQWLKECGRKQVDNGSDGYGYLMWRGKHNSYRADGKYCQFSIVYPEKNAVLSIHAECREGGKLMRLIDEEIYPLI